MKMNREIDRQASDGHTPGISADTELEQKGEMHGEPELERSTLEGGFIRTASTQARESADQAQEHFFKIEFDCTVPEIHKHSSVNPSVPLLHLRVENFTMSRVVLDDQIPSIAFEGEFIYATKIPVVKLPDQTQESFSRIEFGCTIPIIHTRSSAGLSVPLLRLQAENFTMSRAVLDDQVPTISEESIHHLSIPIMNIQQPAPTIHKPRAELARGTPEHRVTAHVTVHEKKKTIIEEETEEGLVKRSESDPPSGGGSGILQESPDVTHYLFGLRNNALSTRRPKIILYQELPEDNSLGSFETFCLCAYREQVGGNLTVRPITRLDETIMTHLDKWANPGRHLITLDLDYFSTDDREKWLKSENLRDFIGRAVSTEYGFVIFKSRNEEVLQACRQLVQGRLANEIGHPLDILEVVPRSFSGEKKRKISSVFWGNYSQDKDEGEDESPVAVHYPDKGGRKTTRSSNDLDAIFNKTRGGKDRKTCRGKYEEEFASFTGGENRQYQIVTKRRSRESDEHYLMKCYVVRYLAEKHQLKDDITEIEENILTEKSLDSHIGSEHVIPDVFDEIDNRYYEIETLFAGDKGGKDLINHLSETVMKYRFISNLRKVYIVIDSTAAVRHMNDLLYLEKLSRDKQIVPVQFLTFDIPSKGLIPIQKVNKKLQELMHANL